MSPNLLLYSIDTPGLRYALQSVQDAEKLMTTYLNAIPLGRFGSAADIASAVSFLASNDSTFVAGIELVSFIIKLASYLAVTP